jgi:hypothetical protein
MTSVMRVTDEEKRLIRFVRGVESFYGDGALSKALADAMQMATVGGDTAKLAKLEELMGVSVSHKTP